MGQWSGRQNEEASKACQIGWYVAIEVTDFDIRPQWPDWSGDCDDCGAWCGVLIVKLNIDAVFAKTLYLATVLPKQRNADKLT